MGVKDREKILYPYSLLFDGSQLLPPLSSLLPFGSDGIKQKQKKQKYLFSTGDKTKKQKQKRTEGDSRSKIKHQRTVGKQPIYRLP